MNNKPTVKYLECYEHELKQAKEGDVGIDIRASENITIRPNETVIVPTNLFIEIPKEIRWCEVRPKSGLSSKGIKVDLGTIDRGYRGEIGVITSNFCYRDYVYKDNNGIEACSYTCYPIEIKEGQKIAQLVFPSEVEFEPIEELSDTERGHNGFGSTGV